MKVAIEPFLIDNALMNYCVFALTAAWLGIRIRVVPAILASVFGAVYALVSLFLLPLLRAPYIKLPLFLIGSLPLYRKAGSILRVLPFMMLSAATVGGSALMLTLLLGGSVTADGTLIGTVPVRAALLSGLFAICLPRIMRSVLHIRKKRSMHTKVIVHLKTHVYELDALIDSGNLLTDPISGLPVVLINRSVDEPTRSIPFYKLSGEGILRGERPIQVALPEYGNAIVDCICAESPEQIYGAQAILPEALIPQEWRTSNVQMDQVHLGTPAFAASHWQTRYLMVHSHKRRVTRTPRPGRGSTLH